MKVDPLRKLKEKIVEFITQNIDAGTSRMSVVIDYTNQQYETEHLVKPDPNKTGTHKHKNGTYKLVEDPVDKQDSKE